MKLFVAKFFFAMKKQFSVAQKIGFPRSTFRDDSFFFFFFGNVMFRRNLLIVTKLYFVAKNPPITRSFDALSVPRISPLLSRDLDPLWFGGLSFSLLISSLSISDTLSPISGNLSPPSLSLPSPETPLSLSASLCLFLSSGHRPSFWPPLSICFPLSGYHPLSGRLSLSLSLCL